MNSFKTLLTLISRITQIFMHLELLFIISEQNEFNYIS